MTQRKSRVVYFSVTIVWPVARSAPSAQFAASSSVIPVTTSKIRHGKVVVASGKIKRLNFAVLIQIGTAGTRNIVAAPPSVPAAWRRQVLRLVFAETPSTAPPVVRQVREVDITVKTVERTTIMMIKEIVALIVPTATKHCARSVWV